MPPEVFYVWDFPPTSTFSSECSTRLVQASLSLSLSLFISQPVLVGIVQCTVITVITRFPCLRDVTQVVIWMI